MVSSSWTRIVYCTAVYKAKWSKTVFLQSKSKSLNFIESTESNKNIRSFQPHPKPFYRGNFYTLACWFCNEIHWKLKHNYSVRPFFLRLRTVKVSNLSEVKHRLWWYRRNTASVTSHRKEKRWNSLNFWCLIMAHLLLDMQTSRGGVCRVGWWRNRLVWFTFSMVR